MSNYINQVSDSLKNHISELANNPCLFLRNPNVDFSRKRKIDFKTFIGIMMNSGGATMSKELLDFFDFDKNTPSVSAFTQQRSKVLPEAFEYLFKSFTDDNLPTTNNYHGYRLIACDGSNLTIATNQKDPETFWERNQHGSIVNKLHLNAFYDVLNRIYTDVLVQTAADYNEFRACATMIDRSKLENVILVADRGYENYNIFAHAIEKGWKFAIRVKDKNSNGIASGLNLPPNDEFDIDITQIFSRKNTKTTKNAGYKWMPVNQVFDYLPRKSDKTYELSFRIIRFPIGSNSYEIIITNLDRNIFDVKKIKEIYHLRWGIETSFRGYAPCFFINSVLIFRYVTFCSRFYLRNLILSPSSRSPPDLCCIGRGLFKALCRLFAIAALHLSQKRPLVIGLPQCSHNTPSKEASERISLSSFTHCLICFTETSISSAT